MPWAQGDADWTHFLVCEPIFCFDSHSTWTQGSLRAEGHHRTPLCGASDVTPGDPPRPTSPSTQMVRCEEGAGWLPSALPCLGAADLVQGSIAPSANRLPMLSPWCIDQGLLPGTRGSLSACISHWDEPKVHPSQCRGEEKLN